MDCFCSLDFHLCSILSYSVLLFHCCVLKCKKKQLKAGRVSSGLEFEGSHSVLVGIHRSWWEGTADRAGDSWSRCILQTASKDWTGSGAGLPSLKAHPHDALPPARSHFWEVVKSSYTALPAEGQAFKCGNLWETSHTQTTPPLPGGNSTPTPSEDIMKSAQLYQVTASFCVILQAFWLELSSSCYSLDCLLPRLVHSSRHE